jgi:hypothetical protein
MRIYSRYPHAVRMSLECARHPAGRDVHRGQTVERSVREGSEVATVSTARLTTAVT